MDVNSLWHALGRSATDGQPEIAEPEIPEGKWKCDCLKEIDGNGTLVDKGKECPICSSREGEGEGKGK
jgi:hypothetical protein